MATIAGTSEKRSIIVRIRSRPLTFQLAIEEVRTLPPTSRKGWFKCELAVFVKKNQLMSYKSAAKFFLCESFQRQSCSTVVPLYNGV